jgi:hypothetical protein
MPLLNQSITVQKIIDQCKIHTNLQNFFNVGGIPNEPGLTICNNALQVLLSLSNNWKFNRNELSGPPTGPGNFFVTQYGVQDYLHAGACAFALLNNLTPSLPCGGASIDLASSPVGGGTSAISLSCGVVTVQTLQTHQLQVAQTVFMTGNTLPAYNSVFTYQNSFNPTCAWTNGFVVTAVPDNMHFKFNAVAGQLNGDATGAPGITNWGHMESAYVTDINNTTFPQPVYKIIAVDRIAPAFYSNGDTMQVCMLLDMNNGILKFRISEPFSLYSWQINCVYQARANKLTTPQSVFNWPDNYSFALHEMCLWQAFRFAKGISAAETQAQKAAATEAIQMVRSADDVEETNEGISPDRSLMSY